MYKVNDYIVYRKDVCVIKEILDIHDTKYYSLEPLNDDSLSLKVPVDNKLIRDVISKEEALKFIDTMKDIKELDLNDKMIEHTYIELLASSNMEDLVKIIKTSYLRNKQRVDAGKKIGEIDDNYFKKAEKYLYTELSIALNKTYDETKEFIINRLEK